MSPPWGWVLILNIPQIELNVKVKLASEANFGPKALFWCLKYSEGLQLCLGLGILDGLVRFW